MTGSPTSSDPTTDTPSLEDGRRRSRRLWALASFLMLLVNNAVILWGLVFSPARESVATALEAGAVAYVGSTTVLASIVLGYLGVSVAERIWAK